jgi:hypothetical protein
MKATWITQNEATDDEYPGIFLQGIDSFHAEQKELQEMGCPDTEHMVFVAHEAVDRDESFMTAEISEAAANWLTEHEIIIE